MQRIILTALLFLSSNGCCNQPLPPQPSRPDTVEGWNNVESYHGVYFRAVLLLKKGESSDDGKLGIKVLNITEAVPCSDSDAIRSRQVEIQFYRPSDGHVLFERTFLDGSNTVVNGVESVDVLGMRAVNTKEGWALFDLRYEDSHATQ